MRLQTTKPNLHRAGRADGALFRFTQTNLIAALYEGHSF